MREPTVFVRISLPTRSRRRKIIAFVADGTSSTSHTAQSVTTHFPQETIVTCHAVNIDTTWTPPTGMMEAADVLSGASTDGVALELNVAVQLNTGASGSKTATSAAPQRGENATMALEPTP